MNNKKILFAILFIFTSLCFAREVKERKTVGLQFSVGGTIPIYGDSNIWNNHEQMNKAKFGRFIFGADFGLTFKLADPLFFVANTESCFDFSSKDGHYFNSIDCAFTGGFQFYPNIANLSFTIAYALGYRTDFVSLDLNANKVKPVKWGNGFKLAAEYDFFAGGGFIPAVGTSWRFMPRGYDIYDNIISIYLRFAFR